ncbi:MAG: right-handed parallel beta-helix repeat-containing protein [Candidatus Aminicenantes bacterium]|nr:right-handed parallel beta-helix repeat-containing protein [Candidatus Aminicenantes bacterium]
MKKIYRFKIVLVVVCLLGVFAGCSTKNPGGDNSGNDNSGADFYVSLDGSDSNDGRKESPWHTVQHGLDEIQPGETLHINAGTYKETLYLDRSGTKDKKIHIKGQSADRAVLDGGDCRQDLFFIEDAQHIEISGLTFKDAPRAGLRLSYSHKIEIHDCVFAGNGRWGIFTDFSDDTLVEDCAAFGSAEEHGIYISNSSDNAVIRNNTVHHNFACGIQINADPSMGGDGISSGCLIENNLVYENGRGGGAAVNLASVRDSAIRNNIIYHNYAGGIAAWDDGQGLEWGSKNLTVIHNTVYFRSGEGRWALSLKNGSTGAHIYNNILCGGRGGGFEYNSNCLNGIKLDYNIYFRSDSLYVVADEDEREYRLAQWQQLNYDPHSIRGVPKNLFVNVINTDFHLKNSAAAVDMGIDKGLAYDFEGDARPQGAGPDVGADEIPD